MSYHHNIALKFHCRLAEETCHPRFHWYQRGMSGAEAAPQQLPAGATLGQLSGNAAAGESTERAKALEEAAQMKTTLESRWNFTLPELNRSALMAGVASPHWNALEKQLAAELLRTLAASQERSATEEK
jgi:hypothetical protein